MADFSENWDEVTASAIPAGWTADAQFTTTASPTGVTPLSSPNVLQWSPAGSSPATIITNGTVSGDGDVTVSGWFVWNAISDIKSQIGLIARQTASSGLGTFYTAYHDAANGVYCISRFLSGIEDVLTSQAGPTPSGWFQLIFQLAGANLQLSVQRASDGYWLTVDDVWGPTVGPLVTWSDSGITGAGQTGIYAIAHNATVASAYSDNFSLPTSTPTPTPTPTSAPRAVLPGFLRRPARPRRQPSQPPYAVATLPPPTNHGGPPVPRRRVRAKPPRRPPSQTPYAAAATIPPPTDHGGPPIPRRRVRSEPPRRHIAPPPTAVGEPPPPVPPGSRPEPARRRPRKARKRLTSSAPRPMIPDTPGTPPPPPPHRASRVPRAAARRQMRQAVIRRSVEAWPAGASQTATAPPPPPKQNSGPEAVARRARAKKQMLRRRRDRMTAYPPPIGPFIPRAVSPLSLVWRRIGPGFESDDWPFVEPSPDVRYRYAAARLVVPATATFQRPFYLVWEAGGSDCYSWLLWDGATPPSTPPALAGPEPPAAPVAVPAQPPVRSHILDWLILDSNGAVVFDTTRASWYQASPYGPEMYVHRWGLEGTSLFVAQRQTFPAASLIWRAPEVVTPRNGQLDDRCVYQDALRVTTLGGAAGAVTLFAGYNTEMSVSTDTSGPAGSARPLTIVTLEAVAGAGLGPVPSCPAPGAPLAGVGGAQTGPLGIATLSASGCYYARPQVAVDAQAGTAAIAPGTIEIGNDCTPCGDCADYVRAAATLNGVFAAAQAVAADAEAVRDAMTSAIARWDKLLALGAQPNVQVLARVRDRNIVDLGIQLCNPLSECLTGYPITVHCYAEDADGTSLPGLTPTFVADSITLDAVCGATGTIVPVLDSDPASSPVRYTLNPAGAMISFTVTWNQVQPFTKSVFLASLSYTGLFQTLMGPSAGFVFDYPGTGTGPTSTAVRFF